MDGGVVHVYPEVDTRSVITFNCNIAVLYVQVLLEIRPIRRKGIRVHSKPNAAEFEQRIVLVESTTFGDVEEDFTLKQYSVIISYGPVSRGVSIPSSTQTLRPISPPPIGMDPDALLLCVVHIVSYAERSVMACT